MSSVTWNPDPFPGLITFSKEDYEELNSGRYNTESCCRHLINYGRIPISLVPKDPENPEDPVNKLINKIKTCNELYLTRIQVDSMSGVRELVPMCNDLFKLLQEGNNINVFLINAGFPSDHYISGGVPIEIQEKLLYTISCSLKNLTKLVFLNTRLSPEIQIKALFPTLSEKLKNLTSLELIGSDITSDTVGGLFNSIQHHPNLIELSLEKNSIGDKAGMEHLAKYLCSTTTLRKLDLSSALYVPQASASTDNLVYLYEALSNNSSLTSLKLGANNIGEEGGELLAKSLSSNTTLTHISLSRNGINDSFVTHLYGNTTLTSLNLNSTDLGMEGLRSICQNTHLKSISIIQTERSIQLERNGVPTHIRQNCGSSPNEMLTLLSGCTHLTSLGLGPLTLEHPGREKFYRMIETTTTLQYLKLKGLQNYNFRKLEEAFSKNSSIIRYKSHDYFNRLHELNRFVQRNIHNQLQRETALFTLMLNRQIQSGNAVKRMAAIHAET